METEMEKSDQKLKTGTKRCEKHTTETQRDSELKQILARFKEKYPDSQILFNSFQSGNWRLYQEKSREAVLSKCPTINETAKEYCAREIIRNIVKYNISSVIAMTSSRNSFDDSALVNASDLFIAKYGNNCTMYQMMVYFSGYLMDYKSTYAAFDMADLLSGFQKKFIPRWSEVMQSAYEKETFNKQNNESGKVSGEEAMDIYIMEAVKDEGFDSFVKNSSLVRMGKISVDHIKKVIKQDSQTF